MKPKPFHRRYGPALLCLLLGALLGAWHNRTTDRGRPDLVAGAARSVFVPPAVVAVRVSHWFHAQAGWLLHGRALAQENQRLKAQVAALQAENTTLQEARIENDRLREDLGFLRAGPYRLLPAEVVALRPDPKFATLLIARGSRDGVRPNSVVVTCAGLVGRVFEVTPSSASVLLLTDSNSGVGARVQRAASRAIGVCEGDGSGLLSMAYLTTGTDIQAGDRLLTSGLGGVFPPGIPIGAVTAVTLETGSGLETAQARPYVDFDRLEEVYVRL